MNTVKNMFMISLGAVGAAMFCKYKEPIMKAVKNTMKKEVDMIDSLDKMM